MDEKSIPEDQKIDWVIIPMRYERADEHNEDFRCLITLHTRERMVSGIYITNSLTQPKQKSTLLCSTTDQHGWFEVNFFLLRLMTIYAVLLFFCMYARYDHMM